MSVSDSVLWHSNKRFIDINFGSIALKATFPCTRFWQPLAAGGGQLKIAPTYLFRIVSI